MISTAHALSNVNPYLASLESLFEGKHASLDWLVIAHNDPVMLWRLSDAIDESASALLQIPQSSWDFDGEDLPQVIGRAIQETEVKHLLVLGHSQAGPSEQAPTWVADGSDATDRSGNDGSSFNRVLEGARRVQQQAYRSKSHFQTQVEHLLAMEEVQEAISLGKLKVHALFFMAQGGMFLRFDPAKQTFEPIVA